MSTQTLPLVGLDAIRDAARQLQGVAQRTPMELSRAMSRALGRPVWLKCEHLQRTGSFKIRGAYNRISRIPEADRARGVVCASAGNHAQGVALSAQLLGVTATVYMPIDAPLPKIEATRAYGAEVVLGGANVDEALAAATAHADRTGATFVHPFDHADVIAGQGTLGLEILEQEPEVRTLLVPIGGGGLIAGIASAVKALKPEVRVLGVEPVGAACALASLRAGEPVTLPELSTIADGVALKRPGNLTLAHIVAYVDEVVTVTDEAIARAVLSLVERAKQVVEPSGAATMAALAEGLVGEGDDPVVVVLSGGNVDPLLFNRIIQSGLYEEGRYLVATTKLSDRPGNLVKLLSIVAERRANVLAVEHHRLDTSLGVTEVTVRLELETRGPDHIRELCEALAEGGYPLEAELPATVTAG